MTTTTDTLQPLAVGDRVTYRGHEGIVTEPNTTDSGMSGYVLLGFTPGDGPTGAWEDRGYPEGKRYYWVHRGDDHLSRLTPRPLQVGDVVDATRNGETRRGTVYAIQGDTPTSPLSYVWAGGTGEEWAEGFSYGDITPHSYAGSYREAMPHSDAPDGVRGHWFYVNDSSRDDTVTLAPADTVEEAPSEAVQAPEDSPEVTALKATVERLEGQLIRQRTQIQAMERDVTTIGEHLKATATRSEWCDEYERHLSRLLDDLSSHTDEILREAAQRVQTYNVTYTYTTTVEASSRDEAEETVRECCDWSSYGEWEVEED